MKTDPAADLEANTITTMDYRESHLQQDTGKAYHAVFADNPYRRMMWQFEKGILDRIWRSFYGISGVRHLDFACGTGRILHYLADRTAERVGVDLSASMLEVARADNEGAELLEADVTVDDVLGERKFDLITAFRFFPNAQPELRRQAMQVLNQHLTDKGHLVFNNHKNTGSTRNRLAILFGHRDYKGMSLAEVKDLLAENNLEVVKMYSLGIFPAAERRLLLPIFLLRPLEALLSKLSPLGRLGENLIFVCQRSSKSSF